MGSCCGVAAVLRTADRDGGDSTAPPSPPRRSRQRHDAATERSAAAAGLTSSSATRGDRRALASLALAATPARDAARGHDGSSTVRATPPTVVAGGGAAAAATHGRVMSASPPLHALSLPNYGTDCDGCGGGGGPDAVTTELFRVSASSSSTAVAALAHRDGDADDDDGHGGGGGGGGGALSSFVEVSQPTQSFRGGDAHTYSEVDVMSEYEPPSFDRLGRRAERRRRSVLDRGRLQYLIASEAEVRASLTVIYTCQHHRLLVHLAKERCVVEHMEILQQCAAARVLLCSQWLVTAERGAREALAREWWTERAALVRRVGPARTPPPPSTPPPPPLASSALAGSVAAHITKREESVPRISTSHTAADLTSSEEAAADDDVSNVRSPSTHASPVVSPSSPVSSSTAAATSLPASLVSARRATAVQQAAQEKRGRGRRVSATVSASP
ncbi:hypothetical protein NESM_000408100 [Novymonas esmeraldas]|uniref:Uncharacterized protein n=1 Tax=Novymonas esmeraldas TaxID=1808958 RepID=A0AAW0END0_9TRYP